MAAQYITLDEAATRLGIPVDEFKRRHKTEWTHLVPMRDGSTLRFRVNQIDEIARQLGAASDPELPLAAMQTGEHGSDDFKVEPQAKQKSPPKSDDEPLVFDSSDDDIFSLSADARSPTSPSSSDSSSGDSDVRLEVNKMPKKKGGSADPEAVPTEEISLDASGGPSSAVIKGGSSAKLSAPKSSGKLSAGADVGKALSSKNNTGDSSEFELSLDADSDDFELQLNTDSSDEVDLGSSPVDEIGGRAGKSGINLKNPGDSGVSLEKGKKSESGRNLGKVTDSSKGLKKSDSDKNIKKPDSGKGLKKPAPVTDLDSDADFELSLEDEPSSDSGIGVAGPKSGPKSGKLPVTSDSDSEFELTLDDSGEGSSLEAAAMEGEESKGDIFETDFEIPPMTDESGSEVVAIDSDTDLEHDASDVALEDSDLVAEEETGSQVVLLEDEEEDAPKAKGRRSRLVDEEGEGDVDLADVEEDDVSAALQGVRSPRLDEDEEDAVTVPGGRPAPRPWGPLPAIILFPTFLVVALGGIMGYEVLHTMMGYQQPRKPAAPLVRGVAKTFDMPLKDQ